MKQQKKKPAPCEGPKGLKPGDLCTSCPTKRPHNDQLIGGPHKQPPGNPNGKRWDSFSNQFRDVGGMLLQRSLVDFNFQSSSGGGGLTNIPTLSACASSTRPRTAAQEAALQAARKEATQHKEEQLLLARESAAVHAADPIGPELDVIFPNNGMCVYACETFAKMHACIACACACACACSCKPRAFAHRVVIFARL